MPLTHQTSAPPRPQKESAWQTDASSQLGSRSNRMRSRGLAPSFWLPCWGRRKTLAAALVQTLSADCMFRYVFGVGFVRMDPIRLLCVCLCACANCGSNVLSTSLQGVRIPTIEANSSVRQRIASLAQLKSAPHPQHPARDSIAFCESCIHLLKLESCWASDLPPSLWYGKEIGRTQF